MYESLIMLDPGVDITSKDLANELNRFYLEQDSKPKITVTPEDEIKLVWDDYQLNIAKSFAPHVREESEEIAENLPDNELDRDRIAMCTIRFETWGREDEDMLYFNDYLFVGEVAAKLGKVYVFDKATDEIVKFE